MEMVAYLNVITDSTPLVSSFEQTPQKLFKSDFTYLMF